jgi:hypothetical protein
MGEKAPRARRQMGVHKAAHVSADELRCERLERTLKQESQTLTGGPAPRLHGEVRRSDFEMQRFESRRPVSNAY